MERETKNLRSNGGSISKKQPMRHQLLDGFRLPDRGRGQEEGDHLASPLLPR